MRTARYHAWILSALVWAAPRPSFEDFVVGGSVPKPRQTDAEVTRNLDLWAAAWGAAPAPANEVSA
jgi:hypothetical protein